MKPLLDKILIILNRLEENHWKDNQSDRIQALERQINLMAGNAEASDKRIQALEQYLQISFKTNYRYESRQLLHQGDRKGLDTNTT